MAEWAPCPAGQMSFSKSPNLSPFPSPLLTFAVRVEDAFLCTGLKCGLDCESCDVGAGQEHMGRGNHNACSMGALGAHAWQLMLRLKCTHSLPGQSAWVPSPLGPGSALYKPACGRMSTFQVALRLLPGMGAGGSEAGAVSRLMLLPVKATARGL